MDSASDDPISTAMLDVLVIGGGQAGLVMGYRAETIPAPTMNLYDM